MSKVYQFFFLQDSQLFDDQFNFGSLFAEDIIQNDIVHCGVLGEIHVNGWEV